MTHHVLIAGGGGIGRALALMLRAEASFPCQVTIGDLSLAAAQEAAAFANAKGDDALATAISVLGPDAGMRLAEEKDWKVLMLIRDGDVIVERMSPAFARHVEGEQS